MPKSLKFVGNELDLKGVFPVEMLQTVTRISVILAGLCYIMGDD